ncbi:MAG: LysR substrate-binding domain-containing protein, partial [Pseudomonadota bacterium]
TSLTTVSRLVAAGQGVTLMPEIAASTEGHDVSLSRFEDPEPGREIGLTVRRGSESAPWRADLIALLREARLTAGRNAGNDAQVPGADANVTSVPEQS